MKRGIFRRYYHIIPNIPPRWNFSRDMSCCRTAVLNFFSQYYPQIWGAGSTIWCTMSCTNLLRHRAKIPHFGGINPPDDRPTRDEITKHKNELRSPLSQHNTTQDHISHQIVDVSRQFETRTNNARRQCFHFSPSDEWSVLMQVLPKKSRAEYPFECGKSLDNCIVEELFFTTFSGSPRSSILFKTTIIEYCFLKLMKGADYSTLPSRK